MVAMLDKLATERRNERTMRLDDMTVEELLGVMNEEDQSVPHVIKQQLPVIAQVVERAITSFKRGGRLIYIGAGTSGRLGILDAAECVPTFGVSADMVVGLIAGGERALVKAVEGAEDSIDLAINDLKALHLSPDDTVVGIAASGRTPYVIGGLDYAREVGATTAALSCNKGSKISDHAEFKIEVETGPEVLTGSTRLKAGTAQKLVLNMISTASMIGVGKVYQNLMVDVQPTNEKLEVRAKRMIAEATGVDEQTAARYFASSNGHVKTAIVMILADVSYAEAVERLQRANGFVRDAI
ncbi:MULTISPECIES: N-acetylmuramic acid 6-phosphate etherase [unclassified Exiguobacterium]|uniref:N-acetylmuramic acid 6-phosphate etherase n=1 Tax=unclassified Exiguobacterium TaxID=2644629 RepID=UPI00103D2260|nr:MULTISPECIES: N-acetylmuramic acid 6-phosphate etherase [unclassified Exiguobacterium]TCI36400.1 N-acetylmuramic acid 6-phosphate etherase [Exiguobacterium sp. SH4S7]TCI48448.1 N-acetylmuramic acid 6-phosphate etherase [Exiguobacterium sp. SH5S32]TCI55336.1 N-acetylmuramic acid 6-phosphate etherase [Exiguobacterium sp. SH1S4]TCI63348.1 N-acetylmuramic acid 6-phosphate etherase [Exiguobacterium sp. SH0S2]TCI75129.1 N-acetylmuramic acid 6-phosphate etherase [Exiguobacterium sp. SH1S1]